jgi:hypothetical protein
MNSTFFVVLRKVDIRRRQKWISIKTLLAIFDQMGRAYHLEEKRSNNDGYLGFQPIPG